MNVNNFFSQHKRENICTYTLPFRNSYTCFADSYSAKPQKYQSRNHEKELDPDTFICQQISSELCSGAIEVVPRLIETIGKLFAIRAKLGEAAGPKRRILYRPEIFLAGHYFSYILSLCDTRRFFRRKLALSVPAF